MFQTFNVALTTTEMARLSTFSNQHYSTSKFGVDEEKLKQVLKKIIDGSLISVSEIEANLFPCMHFHAFISHSHADIKDASILSNFLFSNFGIKSFIDSEFWGNVDWIISNLIPFHHKQDIDIIKKYTSNAYMILAMALVKAMDKTECVFFLNTANSVTFNPETAKIATKSPWICLELLCTQVLRRKIPDRLKTGVIFDSASVEARFSESKSFLYDVDTSHLTQLNYYDLLLWKYMVKQPYRVEENINLLYKKHELI